MCWFATVLGYQVSFVVSPIWMAAKALYCSASSYEAKQPYALWFGPPYRKHVMPPHPRPELRLPRVKEDNLAPEELSIEREECMSLLRGWKCIF